MAIKDIDANILSLLNLEPSFVPTEKSAPHMENISAIETHALTLDSIKIETTSENLRQRVKRISCNFIVKKL